MAQAAKDEKSGCGKEMIVSFPWGLPGLEYTEYALSVPSEELPFYFLSSTSQPEVGLLLIDPFILFKEYEFELSDEVAASLKITDAGQVMVLSTVNTSRGVEKATVNLLAPIVINTESCLGKQVVLNDKNYSIYTPLNAGKTDKGEGR